MSKRLKPAGVVEPCLIALLLLALAVQLGVEAWQDSLTFDETRYVQTGACAWSTRVIDLEVSNPPAHKLLAGAFVRLTGQHTGGCDSSESFFPGDPSQLRGVIAASRAGAVVMALLLALVVFLWSRALFGRVAGVTSLVVVAFEPTLLGHAHLVTGDLPVSLAITACLAAHWRWCRVRRRRWLAAAGLALGFGLLSKPTALLLLPVLAVAQLHAHRGVALRARLRSGASHLLVMSGCGWGLVCLVYLPFRQSHGGWPLPMSWIAPPSWFASLNDVLHAAHGHVNYLNGVIAPGEQPFRLYFLEALGLKTTLGLLALTVAAAIVTIRRRDGEVAIHVWLPALLLVVAASVGATDVGVRYVLPVYPLLAVVAGSVALPGRRVVQRRIAVGVACGAVVASSVAQGPLHVGYVNELAGDRPERFLSDSNLDWGQDAWRLRSWWEANHEPPLSVAYFGTLSLRHYGIRAREVFPGRETVRGLVAVSLTRLTVIGDDTHFPYAGRPYRGLQALKPLSRVGTSILVFDVR